MVRHDATAGCGQRLHLHAGWMRGRVRRIWEPGTVKIYNLRKEHVYARADERGYSRESVEVCFRREIGRGWWEVDVEHPAYPHPRPGQTAPERGIFRGAVGLSKWLLRLDRPAARVATDRLRVCRQCPERVSGVIGTCRLCGCVLRAKVTIRAEKCPAGKW